MAGFDIVMQSLKKGFFYMKAISSLMLLLGLVIHTAVTYGAVDYGSAWLIKSPQNSPWFDLMVSFIHSFRMPVFFVAVGWIFGSWFVDLRLEKSVVNHGVLWAIFKKIIAPFILGVFLICPLTDWAISYSQSAFGIVPKGQILFHPIFLGRLHHLWFLYFWLLLCFVSFLLLLTLRPKLSMKKQIGSYLSRLFSSIWLRTLVLAGLIFLDLSSMGTSFIRTNGKWQIIPSIFVAYFLFFSLGHLLSRVNGLAKWKGNAGLEIGLGVLLFLISYNIKGDFAFSGGFLSILFVKQWFAGFYTSLFVFGFISVNHSFGNLLSPKTSAFFDSAVWIYVVHLPIAVFLSGFLSGFGLPLFLQFGMSLFGTGLICFLMYKVIKALNPSI
jgi:glucans biosynthesis protein C